jgi:hypothetical protein
MSVRCSTPILWIGLVLLRAIGKSSPARRRHGKFVLGWMLGGWLVGAAIGVCIIDNQSYYRNEADTGMAGFGLLIGWAVGMIHGGIALAVSPTKTAQQGRVSSTSSPAEPAAAPPPAGH